MRPKKRSVDELTRLAFIYAEQDRAALAASDRDEVEARELAKELREYRLRRWGRTQWEALLDNVRPVSLEGFLR